MHISAIVLKSKIEGYIFVNGFSMGECSAEKLISVPWDGHTPLFISFSPMGGSHLPTSLAFTTLDSLPVCDNIILTIWTGVVEVEFNPQKSVAYPPPLLPDELKKVEFDYLNQKYSLSLIDYCGIWAILESSESTMICEYLSENTDDCDIKLQFDDPVLIRIEAGKKQWVLLKKGDKFVLENIGQYECKDFGNMISYTSKQSYTPFAVDYQKENDEIKINKYIKSHDYSKQEDIAVDMLSSLIVGDVDYAYSLLSTSLQRAFTPQQIVDYIGSIDHVGKAKYQRSENDTVLAVFSKKSKNVFDAQPFAFEFDTMNKIKNIEPL